LPYKYSQTQKLIKRQTRIGRFICSVALLLSLVLWHGFAKAQAPGQKEALSPISVQSYVKPDTATLGDVVDWTLVVTHDPDIQLLPVEIPKVSGFDIIDQHPPVKKQMGEQIEETLIVQLRADEIGDTPLPGVELKFQVKRADGSATDGQIQASPANISVHSVLRLQGEPEDIRDIKPIIESPPNWTQWFLYGTLVLILLYLGYRAWKNRKLSQPVQFSKEVAPLSAYERALLELKELEKKGYLESEKVREYYFELSEIFRRYLGSQYTLPALDWTTEEIIQWAKRNNEWGEHKVDRLSFLLQRIDRIKFAKAQTAFSGDDAEAVLKFIEDCRLTLLETATIVSHEEHQTNHPSSSQS